MSQDRGPAADGLILRFMGNVEVLKIKNGLFIILWINQLLFAQNSVTDSCALRSQNIEWKASFERAATKEEKLTLVQSKIISDSIYSPKILLPTRQGPSLCNIYVDAKGNDCGAKMLFMLQYRKNDMIMLDLRNDPEYTFIIKRLNVENIYRINAYFGTAAQAVFGTRAEAGVIKLTTKNRKFIREIKKYLKKIE